MTTTFCSHCQVAVVVEVDERGGNSSCSTCGLVLVENQIVSEVTFSEQSGGSAVADGVFLSAGATRAKNRSKYGTVRSQTSESREITLANGYRRISQIGHAIGMTDRNVDSANRYWNLCVVDGFNKGRKTNLVCASCCYIVCRMEKSPHMLIDFADLLQTNVYILGATFLRLVQTLNLSKQLPLVDPALYIARFAANLEFGPKTQDVVKDSNRLVQRMNRDWMQTGRRPAGICAAALFIAARMNNFTRTHREIIKVVRICDATLRKRLDEFKNTPTADLSVNDFKSVWLEEGADPPSFRKSEKEIEFERERERDILRAEKGKVKDKASGKKPERKNKRETEGDQALAPVIRKEKKRKANSIDGPPDNSAQPDDQETLNHPQSEAQSDDGICSDSSIEAGDIFSDADNDDLNGPEEGDEDEYTKDMRSYLQLDEFQTELRKLSVENEDQEDLSWLDNDPELNTFMLDTHETLLKTQLWTIENKEWEENQELKRLKREMLEREKEKNPPKRQKGASSAGARRERGERAFGSAAEATKTLLDAKYKRLSTKLNYEALEGLFGDLNPSTAPGVKTADKDVEMGCVSNAATTSGDVIEKKFDVGMEPTPPQTQELVGK